MNFLPVIQAYAVNQTLFLRFMSYIFIPDNLCKFVFYDRSFFSCFNYGLANTTVKDDTE